jgi:hypothetical protein
MYLTAPAPEQVKATRQLPCYCNRAGTAQQALRQQLDALDVIAVDSLDQHISPPVDEV